MADDTVKIAAAKMAILIGGMDATERAALEKAGKQFVEHIRHAIGTYEYGWTPLKPETLAQKAADTPLLETGELRDSYSYEVHGNNKLEIGSNSDKAVWHEYGTSRGVPPRPVIGGTIEHHGDDLAKTVGDEIYAAICLALLGRLF